MQGGTAPHRSTRVLTAALCNRPDVAAACIPMPLHRTDGRHGTSGAQPDGQSQSIHNKQSVPCGYVSVDGSL